MNVGITARNDGVRAAVADQGTSAVPIRDDEIVARRPTLQDRILHIGQIDLPAACADNPVVSEGEVRVFRIDDAVLALATIYRSAALPAVHGHEVVVGTACDLGPFDAEDRELPTLGCGEAIGGDDEVSGVLGDDFIRTIAAEEAALAGPIGNGEGVRRIAPAK